MTDKELAQRIIRGRRENAWNERDKRLAMLRRDAAFLAAENNLGALQSAFAKADALGQSTAQKLFEEMEQARVVLHRQLHAMGYQEADLAPRFFCPACADTGRTDKGACPCVETVRIQLQLETNPELKGLPKTAEEIDFSYYGERAGYFQKRYEYLLKDLDGQGEDRNFYLLFGTVGTGKTELAKTVLSIALHSGRTVCFLSALELNKLFLQYHLSPLDEKESVLAEVYAADVFLIDDLGIEQVYKNVTLPYFYELIVERLTKKTLITTNLSREQIEDKYEQRILSRLLDRKRVEWIKVDGEDLRIR